MELEKTCKSSEAEECSNKSGPGKKCKCCNDCKCCEACKDASGVCRCGATCKCCCCCPKSKEESCGDNCKCCDACKGTASKCECKGDCRCCSYCKLSNGAEDEKSSHVKVEADKDSKTLKKCCSAGEGSGDSEDAGCSITIQILQGNRDCNCIVAVGDECHSRSSTLEKKNCCCTRNCECCKACGSKSKVCRCEGACKCCCCCNGRKQNYSADAESGKDCDCGPTYEDKSVPCKCGEKCKCCVACHDKAKSCECEGQCKCCSKCSKDDKDDVQSANNACLVKLHISRNSRAIKCNCQPSISVFAGQSCSVTFDKSDSVSRCKCCEACKDKLKTCECRGGCGCCAKCSGQTSSNKDEKSTSVCCNE